LKYTVSDVKSSFRGEKLQRELKTNLLGYLTYRQLSFYLTPIFLALSVPASVVTLITLPVCVLLPVAAIAGGKFGFLCVALLSFTYHLLDYIDGNIARTTGTTSYMGRYLDSFIGNAYWILIYTSLGLLVEYEENMVQLFSKGGVVIGLVTGIIDVFGKESRLYVKLNICDHAPEYVSDTMTIKNVVAVFLGGIGILMPFFIVVAGLVKAIDFALLFIFLHTLLIFLYTQFRIIRALTATRDVEES